MRRSGTPFVRTSIPRNGREYNSGSLLPSRAGEAGVLRGLLDSVLQKNRTRTDPGSAAGQSRRNDILTDSGRVDLDAGAHGGSHDAGLDILALRSGRLRLDDGAEQGVEVLAQLFDAEGGFAGDLVTYCLFPEGSNIDERHWEVLSLAGGDTYKGTTRFQHLEDGKTYTLKVRCPWTIKQEYTFTVKKEEAADGIEGITSAESKVQSDELYDLSGRRITTSFPRGIYIKHGKKILIP